MIALGGRSEAVEAGTLKDQPAGTMGTEDGGIMSWQRMGRSKRRDFFHWGVEGLGATALMQLLLRDGKLLQGSEGRPVAKAKRAVQICLVGGLSHLDSFDYKPELEKFHGKSLETDTPPDIFFWSGWIDSKARLAVRSAREQRPLAVRTFPPSGSSGRSLDDPSIDGLRFGESYTGTFSFEQRIWIQRLSKRG